MLWRHWFVQCHGSSAKGLPPPQSACATATGWCCATCQVSKRRCPPAGCRMRETSPAAKTCATDVPPNWLVRMPSCTASPATRASSALGTAPIATSRRSASISPEPVERRRHSGSDATACSGQANSKATRASRCQPSMRAPTTAGTQRAITRSAISSTVTEEPSSVAAAATSRPIRPAPTTTGAARDAAAHGARAHRRCCAG